MCSQMGCPIGCIDTLVALVRLFSTVCFQMHPLWLCILLCKCFEDTLENTQRRNIEQMHPLMPALWGHIWKPTVKKSQTNAASVIMHPFTHPFEDTFENGHRRNATSVIMYPPSQAIWGGVLKHTCDYAPSHAYFKNLNDLIGFIVLCSCIAIFWNHTEASHWTQPHIKQHSK